MPKEEDKKQTAIKYDENVDSDLINIIKSKSTKQDKIDMVKTILDRAPELLNRTGKLQRTPLMHAILSNELEIVKFLLEISAETFSQNMVKDFGGNNILTYAFTAKDPEIAKLIFEKVKTLHTTEEIEEMMSGEILYPLELSSSLLSYNIHHKRPEMVRLLLQKGIDVSVDDEQAKKECQNQEISEMIEDYKNRK